MKFKHKVKLSLNSILDSAEQITGSEAFWPILILAILLLLMAVIVAIKILGWFVIMILVCLWIAIQLGYMWIKSRTEKE